MLATAIAFAPGLSSPFGTTAFAQEQAAGASGTAEAPPQPLSEEELEILVARIALYPDELVALVTSASLYPLQIVEAARFLEQQKANKDLKPKDSWDGSIISLLNYPEIVKMMSDDLDWTQSLGDALAYQQKDVLVAIQQLRDKAVADGVIKSDDKITVTQDNDNVVIQAANPEKIYVPQYEPEMLYVPGYVPAPIAYYPDPYPNYYYPTATFFAGFVTGAVFGAVVDWDDWGVWGGRWNGDDIDIDCNRCFNDVDINGKVNFNDVDWKNVDRNKISFDKNQFAKIDRTSIRNDFKSVKDNNIANRAKTVRTDHIGSVRNQANRISVDDVRKSKVEARQQIDAGRNKAAAGNRKPADAVKSRPAVGNKVSNVRPSAKIDRQISRPKPGGKIERPGGNKPSALGRVQSGKATQVHSNRGAQALGGGHRGGGKPHREIKRGGGRHR
ncbi:DUF3300 domain-containing protein [Ensifer sp. LC163]|uniref:DUF3300 domain-containing protein n=1 Tax=Ensifer sp. LC163 TaxID=1120652 RepID=UPI000812CA35|nr:DUF3300 domain-containing protein [Ensifer sp. LC163]OCP35852.1 hypothetical protein BC360_27175 [Ensifer sp. LC163]